MRAKIHPEAHTKIQNALLEQFSYFKIDTSFVYNFYSRCKNNRYYVSDTSELVISQGRHVCTGYTLKSKTHASLYLYFPNKKAQLFSQWFAMLGISLLCMLVFGLGFWWVARLYMRQRKMSEITTDFVNNMTHELKTPIASIALAGDLLQKDLQSKEETKALRYVSIIKSENHKLEGMVEQVLESARWQHSHMPLQLEHIPLISLIQSTIDSFALTVKQQHGTVLLEAPTEEIKLLADPVLLRQVLINVLDNAIKYKKSVPEIVVNVSYMQAQVLIEITDHGIGIKKSNLDFVFDAFYRENTGNIHNIKGFGLGLAFCKKVIEAHSGTIRIQSVPMEYTTVSLTLPLQS